MSEEQRRPWKPGDGVRCSEAGRAPSQIPCGRPVITVVKLVEIGWQTRERKRVLCANHANAAAAPNIIMSKCKHEANERLIAEHWDEYQTYLNEAIKSWQAENDQGEGTS